LWVLTAGSLLPALILFTSPLRTMRDLPDRPPDAQHALAAG
jgi:hypothetical protein